MTQAPRCSCTQHSDSDFQVFWILHAIPAGSGEPVYRTFSKNRDRLRQRPLPRRFVISLSTSPERPTCSLMGVSPSTARGRAAHRSDGRRYGLRRVSVVAGRPRWRDAARGAVRQGPRDPCADDRFNSFRNRRESCAVFHTPKHVVKTALITPATDNFLVRSLMYPPALYEAWDSCPVAETFAQHAFRQLGGTMHKEVCDAYVFTVR
jgi:hypothetical protein